MKVIDFFKVVPKIFQSPSVTLGMFDGVHRGHQKLLVMLNELAQKAQGESLVITFKDHPKQVLTGKGPPSIVSFDTRLALLESYGVGACLVIEFNREVAQISPEAFIEEYLIRRLQIHNIVTGKNASFGYQGKGDIALLKSWGKKCGYDVYAVELSQLANGVVISSTNIRNAVQKGDMEQTEEMLGRPFLLSGKVVAGDGRGKALGFPTANLDLLHTLVPAEGVYCGYCAVREKKYPALISIGRCPTFTADGKLKVEVYLLGFSGDLYGQILETHVWKKMRDQQAFPDRESLCRQLEQDRQYLLNYPGTAKI